MKLGSYRRRFTHSKVPEGAVRERIEAKRKERDATRELPTRDKQAIAVLDRFASDVLQDLSKRARAVSAYPYLEELKEIYNAE